VVSFYFIVCEIRKDRFGLPNCDLSVNGRKGRVRAMSGSEVGESRRLNQKIQVLRLGFFYPLQNDGISSRVIGDNIKIYF